MKLNSLISKDYNFFLGRNYFTSNDVSQNTFIYHPTLDRLELKEDKGTDDLMMFSAENQSEYSILKLRRCIMFSCITKLSEHRIGIKFDKDPLAIRREN